jgi:hypothetical protein
LVDRAVDDEVLVLDRDAGDAVEGSRQVGRRVEDRRDDRQREDRGARV